MLMNFVEAVDEFGYRLPLGTGRLGTGIGGLSCPLFAANAETKG